MNKFICIECNSTFETENKKQRTCEECKNKKIKCDNCGVEIDRFSRNGYFRATKKYCNKCSKSRVEKAERVKRSVKCKECGNIFSTISNYSNIAYCSDDCRRNFAIRTRTKSSKKYNIKCKICGLIFESEFATTKYCSDNCRNKVIYNKKNNITKNNYEYIIKYKVTDLINKCKESSNKISKIYYTFGFTSNVMEEVKDRDNWECQICGKRTSLEIHHIVKVKYGGDSNTNNLITLCTSCHRAIDSLNIEHAIKKCTRNAMEYLGIKKETEINNHKEVLQFTKIRLERLFKSIEKIDNEELEEILIQLDDIIDKTVRGYEV